MQFADSPELCRWVREQQGDRVVLSFSRGKDAIGAWIQLRRYFTHILPVHMYIVPGLRFVDDSIKALEDHFGTHIVQMPSPSLYRWLRELVFCSPERAAYLETLDLPRFGYDDLFAIVKEYAGLPQDTFIATGVRAVDSPGRWANVTRNGPVNERRGTFYPIYDWRKMDLVREIAAEGCKLPPEYRLFGRSFDGLDYRFLAPLREHYPDDYARILEWFPMADVEIVRRESWEKRHAGEKKRRKGRA